MITFKKLYRFEKLQVVPFSKSYSEENSFSRKKILQVDFVIHED